ncbi:MAG: LysE family translocator [Burkholderiaceae bacterium]
MLANPWLALALFAFVSSITPGPNNLLATASGARFGLRRTLPQVAGVTFGFTVLLWLAASGVATLVTTHPTLGLGLALVGYAYLLWLSYRLLAAAWRPGSSTAQGAGGDGPMTFLQATLFQFANPKAWMMALSAASSFLPGHDQSIATIVALGALFAVINFPCVGAWAAMGAHLQGWLQDPDATWRLRAFNGGMGGLLLLTTAWMITLR